MNNVNFETVEEKNSFAENMLTQMDAFSALESLLLGRDLTLEETGALRQFDCIKAFLDAPVGDPIELPIKTIFAASIIAAAQYGCLPVELPAKHPVEIASVVEKGLIQAKTVYQVGKGMLDVAQASNVILDSAASAIVAASNFVVNKAIPFVPEKICNIIEKAIPVTKPVTTIAKSAINFAVGVTSTVVEKGVKLISNFAKATISTTVNVVSKVGAKVKSFFSSLFS